MDIKVSGTNGNRVSVVLATGPQGLQGDQGDQGIQGPPGPGTGAGAWQPTTAYTTNQVVQAPDGSIIYRLASGTSRASFDSTEKALWAANSSRVGTIEQVSQSASYAAKDAETSVPGTFTFRTIEAARGAFYSESMARGTVHVGGASLENSTWSWGFNKSEVYTKTLTAEPMLRIGMESSWLNPDGETVTTEFHLAYIDPSQPADATEIRPFSFSVIHGGDGGLGSVTMGLAVSETYEGGGFGISTVTGDQLASLTPSGWYFNRNTSVMRGASAPSLLTIGDHLNDAGLVLDAKSAGGNVTLEFQRGGVGSWLLYDAADLTTLYLRDLTNGRSHAVFIKGATDDTAFTDLHSQLRVKGYQSAFGPNGEVSVGTLGTAQGWLDSTVALNLRAQSGVITSLSPHQFNDHVGFYGAAAVAKPTGVAVSAAGVHAALVTLGLIAA